MTRTRGGIARRPNNFDNRRFAAAKGIANARRRNIRFKTKFILSQGKNVDVKVGGNVVRRMRIRKRSIVSAMQTNRQY